METFVYQVFLAQNHDALNNILKIPAYFDPVLGTRVMVIGEPIWSTDNELLGVLGAKLSVHAIDDVLAGHAQSDTDAVFLTGAKNRPSAQTAQQGRGSSGRWGPAG